jgi:hypothetical protein
MQQLSGKQQNLLRNRTNDLHIDELNKKRGTGCFLTEAGDEASIRWDDARKLLLATSSRGKLPHCVKMGFDHTFTLGLNSISRHSTC